MSKKKDNHAIRTEPSYDDALLVTPIEGGDTMFSRNILWDYCGTLAAHGGYLVSLIFSAAPTYMNTHHPNRSQPDPIASHVQFLSFVPPGPVRLCVQEISLGRRVSVIEVKLQRQDETKSGDFKTCVLGVLTQGNIATEKDITLPTKPTILKSKSPSLKYECVDYVLSDDIVKLAPAVAKLVGRVLPGRVDGNLRYPFGPSVREMWYARRDGHRFNTLMLGALYDCFDGVPGNYSNNQSDYSHGIAYPTLSMSTEIKKDPQGLRWLFIRVRSHRITHDRFDTEVQVFDKEGELVAPSKHVSLVAEGKLQILRKRSWR